MRIRLARIDELAALQDIERAAGLCFVDIGPQLRAIRPRETEHALDRWPRVRMQLDL